MNPPRLPLAVYGTLRPGGRAYAAFGLATRTRHLGACHVRGALIDLGGYPALIAGSGMVAADLLAVDDAPLLDELDRFEGPDYARVTEQALDCTTGAALGAVMLWRWVGVVPATAPTVPGNDWRLRTGEEIDPNDDR